RVREDIVTFAAFRESNERVLRRLANWPAARPYVIDNLPERVSGAYADLLFGEDPRVTAASPDDQDQLAAMLGDTPAALWAAEDTNVSEGEIWWRLCVDRLASLHPIVTFHSRADVVPLLVGRECPAVAFVSVLGAPTGSDGDRVADAENPSRPCWRHLEIHADGVIENHLYRGTWTEPGDRVGPPPPAGAARSSTPARTCSSTTRSTPTTAAATAPSRCWSTASTPPR